MSRSITPTFATLMVFAGLGLVALGCGGSSEFSTVPVRGTVQFNGKPMEGGGSIALMPLSNQQGKMAGGEIKPDGTFVLSTYGNGDGSIPGEFRVVIHQTTVVEPGFQSDGSESAVGEAGTTVSGADLIPPIYSDQFNSPLTAKIEPTGTNDLVLTLDKH